MSRKYKREEQQPALALDSIGGCMQSSQVWWGIQSSGGTKKSKGDLDSLRHQVAAGGCFMEGALS